MRDIEPDLAEIVGASNLMATDNVEPRYGADASDCAARLPRFVVKPGTREQVSAVLALADAVRCPVTPQGGRTGMVGGAISSPDGIALSLERMNRIHEIDELSMSMTVEAGVTLQQAQEAAADRGLLLPLDLGSRGSATIGGNVATNAGGLRVLRWGMMRDMVLGLEAVLADGTVVSSEAKTIKDNAGYNWRQLIIGSEGTLAVVTKVVLRLRPLPKSWQLALVASPDFPTMARLLRFLEAELAGTLSSFEVMWPAFYDYFSTFNLPKRARPLPLGNGCYALVEALGQHPEQDAARFESALSMAMEKGQIADAVIANSQRERANLWSLREDMMDAYRAFQPSALFDVSLALADMPGFVAKAEACVKDAFPEARLLFYGHAGDGNLHIVVNVGPTDVSEEDVRNRVYAQVFTVLAEFDGSISAEHGVGTEKRDFLHYTRSSQEIEMMRRIKQALDPHGILNPGKIFA